MALLPLLTLLSVLSVSDVLRISWWSRPILDPSTRPLLRGTGRFFHSSGVPWLKSSSGARGTDAFLSCLLLNGRVPSTGAAASTGDGSGASSTVRTLESELWLGAGRAWFLGLSLPLKLVVDRFLSYVVPPPSSSRSNTVVHDTSLGAVYVLRLVLVRAREREILSLTSPDHTSAPERVPPLVLLLLPCGGGGAPARSLGEALTPLIIAPLSLLPLLLTSPRPPP
mmetsp:Transcript_4230/g.10087  ORF Transcript_4230/g.10087 Transcript_4230/m.10087 type:complete len:225 (-) Transcript_4230:5-679(-)